MCTVTMDFTGQSRNLHIMAGFFSLDIYKSIFSKDNRFVGIWVGIPN